MKIVIAGAGDYGKVYASYLRATSQFKVIGFLDDDPDIAGQVVDDLRVLGTTSQLNIARDQGAKGVFAPIGNNTARADILARARRDGFATPNFIHDTATVSDDTHLEPDQGVYILPGTMVMPFVQLEDFVMLSASVSVAHHTCLRRGVFVSMGTNIGANVDVEENAFLGIGSTIMTGVKEIGQDVMVGAGSVVIDDVSAGETVAGVPARTIG